MRPRRTRSLLVSALVLALAGLGWVYLAPTQIGGSTRYVVTHGISMKPLLHTDDLVLVRPASQYRVGEVVAYHSTLLHTVVLHRIIRIDGSHYVFKGDNNDFIDPTQPTRSLLIGKMWLLVPNGGVVLAWLHTPWVAALLVAAVATLLLFGGERKRRRRRDRGRRQSGGTNRARSALPVTGPPARGLARRQLLVASGIGMLVFAALAAFAFARSATDRTGNSQSYTQQVRFGYHARVRAGPVYPIGAVTTGEPIYLQLVHRVTVTAAYRLVTGAPSRIHGTIRIRGTLANTSGWSRSFWLGPTTAFVGDRASAGATISLSRLESLTSRISAQIGDGGSYTLAVVPHVKVAGRIGGEPVTTAYSPVLSLSLGTSQLLSGTPAIGSSSDSAPGPTGSAAQQGLRQSTTATLSSTHGTVATLVGVPVKTVRRIALAGLAIFAVLALFATLKDGDGDPDPAERIKSRYKHLIVPVEPVTPSTDHPPIDVSSIDALAQLAERSERLILHDHQDDVDNYLIDDQGTLFRFSAPRLSTPHMNGTASANGTGIFDAHAGTDGTGEATEDSATGGIGDSGLSEPAASAAAAILSSAAASLSAAAAEASAATAEAAAATANASSGPRPSETDDAAEESEVNAKAPAGGPVAAPMATGAGPRSVSHLRAIGADPRRPPTATMAQRSIRPEYRLGFTIGPLALAFLAWRHVRARRRRLRGDDAEEAAKRSWKTRNLARR